MAWKDLGSELGELFGELTNRTDEMLEALDFQRQRLLEWERARNKEPARRAYKNAWARAERRQRGLKRKPGNNARAAGWGGLSEAQKQRHNEMRRLRRARAREALDAQRADDAHVVDGAGQVA